jgi:diguanylate cyclase (GGDEF)-like protein
MRISSAAPKAGANPTQPRPGSHLVLSTELPILFVIVLLITVLVVAARSASSTAASASRASAALAINSDLDTVDVANVALEAAFERASGLQDLGARALEFSNASATGTKGTSAFSTYVQRSLNLPHEATTRTAYERANDQWSLFAGQFGPLLVSPATTAASIATATARLHSLHSIREARLGDLRHLYNAETSRDQLLIERTQRSADDSARAAIVITLALGIASMVIAGRRAARRTRAQVRVEFERASTARRTDFEARLQRSMVLTANESMVLESVAHTLDVVGFPAAEFLVAEHDAGDFSRAIPAKSGSGCAVERASDCPSVRLRQRLDFADSQDIDACPYLRQRSAEVGGCVCVPVTIADLTLAVLRAEAPVGERVSAEESEWLEILARNTGDKLSSLRVFARSQRQAATDPLTGLANRRTLEHAIQSQTAAGTYAVMFADIDHFKDLNDTFGHDVGDECLRVFARVLERATRPGDLCARYGGDEFVVLLPNASSDDADGIAGRIQSILGVALLDAHLAPFTVSIGLASTEHASNVEEIIRAADHAMFDAKAAGRNRIVAEAV